MKELINFSTYKIGLVAFYFEEKFGNTTGIKN